MKLLYNHPIKHGIKYEQLSVATGSDKKDIKKSEAVVIDSAINQLLRKVPGGCYIANAKIYVVKKHYLAVSGDVWGIKPQPVAKQITQQTNDLPSFSLSTINN